VHGLASLSDQASSRGRTRPTSRAAACHEQENAIAGSEICVKVLAVTLTPLVTAEAEQGRCQTQRAVPLPRPLPRYYAYRCVLQYVSAL
jgi:hypothetical protein